MSETTAQAPDVIAAPLPVLTFDQIIAAPDLPVETVDVPEWAGSVKIQGLSRDAARAMRERSKITRIRGGKPVDEVDEVKLEQAMLSACLVDPAITPEQATSLSSKANAAIDRVLKAVLRLSGMTKEAQEEASKSDSAES